VWKESIFVVISFSGLDGAGKTTHIQLTEQFLLKQQHKVKILRMYDHVSVSAWLRKKGLKGFVRATAFKQSGKAEKEKPRLAKGYRSDKNRKEIWLVSMRQLVYLLDLAVFLVVKYYHETLCRAILICDRHLIDSIVNLLNTNRVAAFYSIFLLSIIPKPDIAILIDIKPEVAFQRKPEYPLSYNIERREAYLEVFRKLKGGVIIPSTTISETQSAIEEILLKSGGTSFRHP